MSGRVIRFPARPMSPADGQAVADRILAVPASERIARSSEFSLDDPETLLLLCARLRQLLDSKPLSVREDAESLYRFLADPKRPVGLFDEREYFLGELALLVGTATRMLALRDEACRWFDRAEANFRLTVNAVADWSRVAGSHHGRRCRRVCSSYASRTALRRSRIFRHSSAWNQPFFFEQRPQLIRRGVGRR